MMRVGGPVDRLRPDRPVGPVLDLSDRPNDARVDPFSDLPRALTGVALVAHLRHDVPLAGRLGERAGLRHGSRQRLLAIHVLAPPHRLHRDDRVCVVGCRNDHGVEIPLAIQHLPIVGVRLGPGILPERSRGEPRVDVTQCHDVLAATALEVSTASAADADPRDVERVAGSLETLTSEHVARHDGQRGS